MHLYGLCAWDMLTNGLEHLGVPQVESLSVQEDAADTCTHNLPGILHRLQLV